MVCARQREDIVNSEQAAVVALSMGIGIVAIVLWVYLIVGGVRAARERNRSPHWRWFGIHPLGALITFFVMRNLAPLKECAQCAQKAKMYARVCAYCGQDFPPPSPRRAWAEPVEAYAGEL